MKATLTKLEKLYKFESLKGSSNYDSWVKNVEATLIRHKVIREATRTYPWPGLKQKERTTTESSEASTPSSITTKKDAVMETIQFQWIKNNWLAWAIMVSKIDNTIVDQFVDPRLTAADI